MLAHSKQLITKLAVRPSPATSSLFLTLVNQSQISARSFSGSNSSTNEFHSEHIVLKPQLDLKRIRSLSDYIKKNISNRKSGGDVDLVCSLYDRYVKFSYETAQLQRERNQINSMKVSVEEKRRLGLEIKERLHQMERELSELKDELDQRAMEIPVDSHPDAPVGPESNAREIYHVGTRKSFDFVPRDHYELCELLNLADFSLGSVLTGSSFSVLRNDGALLELALTQFALSMLRKNGFEIFLPPDVVKSSIAVGCGFQPRPSAAISAHDKASGVDSAAPAVASQMYSIEGTDLCLVGTSEISLAGVRANSVFSVDSARGFEALGALSHCFRREAGGGLANRGLFRLHQFSKVEMFVNVDPTIPETEVRRHIIRDEAGVSGAFSDDLSGFQTPLRAELAAALIHSSPVVDNGEIKPLAPNFASDAMLARLVQTQVEIIEALGLEARVLDMPTEELGAAAYRKVDVEAYMPGRLWLPPGASPDDASALVRGAYGEVSSASNCYDYQARRLLMKLHPHEAKSRMDDGKSGKKGKLELTGKPFFPHTLNGTAVAIPRLIIAILETHQREDGSVVIPEVLRPFMGVSVLHPAKNKIVRR